MSPEGDSPRVMILMENPETKSILAPIFLGDHLAIDFVNSIASPFGSPMDWLKDAGGLFAWMVDSGVMSQDAAQQWQEEFTADELAGLVTEARALREWFRAILANHVGTDLHSLSAEQLEPLNTLLRRDSSFMQIRMISDAAGTPARPVCQRERHGRSIGMVLLPVAEAMGELLCERGMQRVRHCEGAGCTLWFLDQSKRGDRRWCSMAICGNRAKVAAFRARAQRG